MANYIMQIFRAYAMVVFSWGFNAPTAIANGLRFKVQGFKFKGTVEVVYNEATDLFEVKLIKNGKVVETVEDENGALQKIDFKNTETFNFGFDIVDGIAKKYPDKLAMIHLDKKKVYLYHEVVLPT